MMVLRAQSLEARELNVNASMVRPFSFGERLKASIEQPREADMSASEKTHLVVILLMVLGGVTVLGCVVLAGAALFVTGTSDNPRPPAIINTAPQVQSASSSSGKNIVFTTKTVRLSPGQYEVTVTDHSTNLDNRYEFNAYEFVVHEVFTPKTTIKIKSQPKGDPLPSTLETVLLINTPPEQKIVKFAYKVTKSGGTHISKRSGREEVRLKFAQDLKKADAKTPKEKTPAPK